MKSVGLLRVRDDLIRRCLFHPTAAAWEKVSALSQASGGGSGACGYGGACGCGVCVLACVYHTHPCLACVCRPPPLARAAAV